MNLELDNRIRARTVARTEEAPPKRGHQPMKEQHRNRSQYVDNQILRRVRRAPAAVAVDLFSNPIPRTTFDT
jgi:hypothetical protein